MELTSNDPAVTGSRWERPGEESAYAGKGGQGPRRMSAKDAEAGAGSRSELTPCLLGGDPSPGACRASLHGSARHPWLHGTGPGLRNWGSAQKVVTDTMRYTCRGAVPPPHWRPRLALVTGKCPAARDRGPIGPCLVLRGETCEEPRGTRRRAEAGEQGETEAGGPATPPPLRLCHEKLDTDKGTPCAQTDCGQPPTCGVSQTPPGSRALDNGRNEAARPAFGDGQSRSMVLASPMPPSAKPALGR